MECFSKIRPQPYPTGGEEGCGAGVDRAAQMCVYVQYIMGTEYVLL